MIHYPRYVGSYLKRTMGLSMLRDGAYGRLLDFYYANECPLPLAMDDLYGIARCRNPTERQAVDHVLPKYFIKETDGWHNARADAEIAKYHGRSASASASAQARWNNRNANASRTHKKGNASQNQKQKDLKTLDPSDPVGQEPDAALPQSIKAMNAAAFSLLGFLNEKTMSRYQPVAANIKPIVALLKAGFTEKQIRQVIANRVLKWGKDPKMDEYLRPKTLFGATNFANYAGQLGKPIGEEGTE